MRADIQNFLCLGQLKLERTYSGGETATGVLDIVQAGYHFFQCREHGKMILPTGYEGDFSKKFSLRFDGEIIKIYCDHEADDFYQTISPILLGDGWHANGIHYCIDDIYKTDYAFTLGEEVTVIHTITGPKKNYVSKTSYHRL